MRNNVTQNVSGNQNATSLNIAGGNITSNTTVSSNDVEEINALLEKLKEMISQEELKEYENDSALDDIETIQEQLKCDKPKKVRLKSAIERIKQFALKIPSAIASSKLIVDTAVTIYDKIIPIVQSII